MSIQNKTKVCSLGVNLDFMYTGCVLTISWADAAALARYSDSVTEYRVITNRKTLSISRWKDKKWESIIPADFTMNPMEITEEEKFMVQMLPGLNKFERELYAVSGVVARMWHNDADEEYAKKYVIEFLKDYLEW
uniref:Tail protein n=1 Tax=Salmonella phage vB_SEnST11_KE22 TaxID=3161173 RepID=A0AAU8GEH2_9CAUD